MSDTNEKREPVAVGSDSNEGLGVMARGTDLFPLMLNARIEGETPTAILGVDALVRRRDDGGLIVAPLGKISAENPAITFDGKSSRGSLPGFTIDA